MCESCWADLGQPRDWNADVQHALRLIQTIYETELTGAPLHVVLDDWNLEDAYIEIYEDVMRGPDAVASTAAEAAIELVPLLKRMTLHERAATLAYHQGFAIPPEQEPAS